MSYSYQKQIERLLNFVNRVRLSYACTCDYDVNYHCLTCEANELLNDEPVRLNQTTYGRLENPNRPVKPYKKNNYPQYF
jgi:hypothetical protein